MGIIRRRFHLARSLWDPWNEETAEGIVGLPRLLLRHRGRARGAKRRPELSLGGRDQGQRQASCRNDLARAEENRAYARDWKCSAHPSQKAPRFAKSPPRQGAFVFDYCIIRAAGTRILDLKSTRLTSADRACDLVCHTAADHRRKPPSGGGSAWGALRSIATSARADPSAHGRRHVSYGRIKRQCGNL
jgi:hypothetical protein